jgi:hypothetical protein
MDTEPQLRSRQSQSLHASNEREIRYRDGQITQVARSVAEIATLMQCARRCLPKLATLLVF